ncbi:DUF4241 domain-containing protein [Cytophagaceae bacterium DM2B3-1]|uniref:DUF4241 domain-containing protein n=2 Tax=Xanthocytophaga TaxID=3078918 RepID=A0ABT7CQX5_9BACT|nr:MULTISPECIES: DUF4241 domain-containing protein [Xanthocytophaga]MDJ1496157.1 DUF4241 domain-containing protein [Xanthocytophaga flavus]MDJ1502108.1 DUF4241 domain-containing protein [Xanthocytophaga agilis]
MNHNDIEIYFDLSASNNLTKLIEVPIGELNLPTGRIIAGDPFFLAEGKPFVKAVPPGKYPVVLYIREVEPEHYRIAFAKIKFNTETATQWLLAVSEDMDIDELQKLEEDDFFGFAVDAGLACFLDEQTNVLYQQKINELHTNTEKSYYDNILADEFESYSSQNQYSSLDGDWNNHFPDPQSDLNVMMFASGWGDGLYPAYWGLNHHKEIVELTIDFMVESIAQ